MSLLEQLQSSMVEKGFRLSKARIVDILVWVDMAIRNAHPTWHPKAIKANWHWLGKARDLVKEGEEIKKALIEEYGSLEAVDVYATLPTPVRPEDREKADIGGDPLDSLEEELPEPISDEDEKLLDEAWAKFAQRKNARQI